MSIDIPACKGSDDISEKINFLWINNFSTAVTDVSHAVIKESNTTKLNESVSDRQITILCLCNIVGLIILEVDLPIPKC